ncbi:tetratricopeptide repeat protein [Thaumasiovibrio sp. DFM-14]|uniref:tetratricopeptide repeat protein n=1 Tax=Thaumasiovibrio sp. DFM-14 TaxID=3384792 RepID=UPI0039A1379A
MKNWLLTAALLMCSTAAPAEQLSQYAATRVQRAHALQREGEISQAIALLSPLTLARTFDQAYIHRMLGILYWHDGQLEQATNQLQIALDSNQFAAQEQVAMRQMLADLFMAQSKFSLALVHYMSLTDAYDDKSENARLWLRIAQSHYQLAAWQETLDALQHYVANLGEMHFDLYRMRLGAELSLNQDDAAIVTLQSLIEIEPSEYNWWQTLAAIHLRHDHHHLAMQTLAIAYHNGILVNRDEQLLLAQLYAQQGVPERAARLLSSLAPHTEKELVTLAFYWQMAQEWNEAIAVLEQIVPLNNHYRSHLVSLLRQQQNYEAALYHLNYVDNPNVERIQLQKIDILYRLSRYDDAALSAKQLVELTGSKEALHWDEYLSTSMKSNLN